MLPDITRAVSLPPAPAQSTFNHRTAAIIVTVVGVLGCFLELAEPAEWMPQRLVLFAVVLGMGIHYLVWVARRARRRRRVAIGSGIPTT